MTSGCSRWLLFGCFSLWQKNSWWTEMTFTDLAHVHLFGDKQTWLKDTGMFSVPFKSIRFVKHGCGDCYCEQWKVSTVSGHKSRARLNLSEEGIQEVWSKVTLTKTACSPPNPPYTFHNTHQRKWHRIPTRTCSNHIWELEQRRDREREEET